MKATERDTITSMKVKYMCLDYFCPMKASFCNFLLSCQFLMHRLELCFTVQGWIKEVECSGKAGKVQRGSKESLTLFQRVSQSLDIRKHHF